MAEFLYKMYLTYNATSLLLVTFLIKERYYLNILKDRPIVVSYVVFISISVVLIWISLKMSKLLSKDSIEVKIVEVENANNAFLPSYLGYFFVALSVATVETMIFVSAMIFVFTFVSQTLYFNPLFLCFGYHFYYVTTEDNIKNFIITKKSIRTTRDLKFNNLRRINNFTYIDVEEKE